MTLWQFTAREVKSRPGRAALTLFSVIIGVAAVVSVAMSTITTRHSYDKIYQTLTGRAAVEIYSETGQDFDEGIVDRLAERPDVRSAIPVVQRLTNLYYDVTKRNKDGEEVQETEKLRVLAMAIDPERDRDARDYKLVEGKFFNGSKGVLLETDFAKSLGLKLGDEIRALTPSSLRPKKLEIVGLLAPEGAAALRQGVMFLHLKNAQKLFNLAGKVDSIHLVPKDFAKSEQLLASVATTLPPGLAARKPLARSQLSEETLQTPQQGLELASALSLIVALLIILNTFLMNVSERRRQFSILRAIGATQGQIRRLLIGEGLLLGFLGTCLGMLLGLVGALYLTRVMGRLFDVSLPALEITPLPFILGAIMGVGVSLAATYFPARLASRVSPLEGLRPVTQTDLEGVPAWVGGLGVLLLILAAGLLAAFMYGYLLKTTPIIAAITALLGFVLLIPASLGPLSRVAIVLLHPLLRMEGDLAGRQLLRRRTRTVLTTGVLFTALAAGIGLGNTFINNANDVRSWFDKTVIGDFFVRASLPDMSSGESPDIPETLGDEIRQIPGVTRVGAAKFVTISIGEQGAILVARDFNEPDDLPLDLRQGNKDTVFDQLQKGEVVVGTVLAHKLKLKPGDDIELATKEGKQTFRIAGTANEYLGGGLAVYINRPIAGEKLGITGVDGFAIKCDRKSLFKVEVKLKELAEAHGLMLQSWADMRRTVDDRVNGIIVGLWVILAMVLVVAGFGIVNTLTMNVLEQTRELGLLRIVAMTRGQVRKMILSQATIMGFIALIPGALVGILIAYFVSRAGEGEFGRLIEFKLHPMMVWGAFAVTYAIVVLAAWIPAMRAARLQLTEALRYE
jgi:putative ABC transport system permease protein